MFKERLIEKVKTEIISMDWTVYILMQPGLQIICSEFVDKNMIILRLNEFKHIQLTDKNQQTLQPFLKKCIII